MPETGQSDNDTAAADGPRVTGPWDDERVTAFLTDTQVPIRLACHTDSGGLWMLSLWYAFRDGRLCCATASDADVVSFLRSDPAVAFEVSVNEPPYRGVRGQGTASIDPDGGKDLLRSLVDRYLGGTDNDLADWLLAEDREEVRIVVEPTRLSTWDYSNRM
jgi:Predicted flavin-nucleotide-binding protein